MEKIILASQSQRRIDLLSSLGLNFHIVDAQIDEAKALTLGFSPCQLVQYLAFQKANKVFECMDENIIVIGADTIIDYCGNVFGKPTSKKDAFSMLSNLRNKQHLVHTGVCLLRKQNGLKTDERVFVETTKVQMRNYSDEEIENYIDTDEPIDKAGSYAIQGQGGLLVQSISGDYNSVVGLPLSKVYDVLLDWGYKFD